MSSTDDIYCDRCDVFGHVHYTEECELYWSSEEAPFGRQMRELVGTIMKLGDVPPELWDDQDHEVSLPPGTYVRLTHYTPWLKGMKAGNHFSIRTLDGLYSAAQVHLGELCELDPLDKLALIDESEREEQDESE